MEGWKYMAKSVRVVDGDTFVIELEKSLDFGFSMVVSFSVKQKLRLRGVNTPEVVGSQKELGLKAKAAVESFFAMGVGPIDVTTYKPDKYGRWLADVKISTKDGTVLDLAKWLLEQSLAEPYMADGG